jgi:flagellar motor switch protein FliM
MGQRATPDVAPLVARFSGLLQTRTRTNVSMRVSGLESMAFKEFPFALANPTCLCIVRAQPLDDQLLIEIPPHILFPIIDRLLGGRVESGPIPQRPLTEIEQRLASRIMSWFLDELAQCWQSVAAMEFSVDRFEHNPLRLRLLPPSEPLVVVRLEIDLPSASGTINLGIPQRCLNAMGDTLVQRSGETNWPTTELAHVDRGTDHASHESVSQVVATLAESTISMADLVGLRVGDIILTDKSAHEPIQIAVDGTPRYEAAIGTVEGRKAIRIKSAIPNHTDQAPIPDDP